MDQGDQIVLCSVLIRQMEDLSERVQHIRVEHSWNFDTLTSPKWPSRLISLLYLPRKQFCCLGIVKRSLAKHVTACPSLRQISWQNSQIAATLSISLQLIRWRWHRRQHLDVILLLSWLCLLHSQVLVLPLLWTDASAQIDCLSDH